MHDTRGAAESKQNCTEERAPGAGAASLGGHKPHLRARGAPALRDDNRVGRAQRQAACAARVDRDDLVTTARTLIRSLFHAERAILNAGWRPPCVCTRRLAADRHWLCP